MFYRKNLLDHLVYFHLLNTPHNIHRLIQKGSLRRDPESGSEFLVSNEDSDLIQGFEDNLDKLDNDLQDLEKEFVKLEEKYEKLFEDFKSKKEYIELSKRNIIHHNPDYMKWLLQY